MAPNRADQNMKDENDTGGLKVIGYQVVIKITSKWQIEFQLFLFTKCQINKCQIVKPKCEEDLGIMISIVL